MSDEQWDDGGYKYATPPRPTRAEILDTFQELQAKDRLILALAEKLFIVSSHLGRLSERREVRGT